MPFQTQSDPTLPGQNNGQIRNGDGIPPVTQPVGISGRRSHLDEEEHTASGDLAESLINMTGSFSVGYL